MMTFIQKQFAHMVNPNIVHKNIVSQKALGDQQNNLWRRRAIAWGTVRPHSVVTGHKSFV